MAIITLTRGMQVELDDEDFEALSHLKWYALAGGGGKFYAYRMQARKGFLMHRVIMNAPDGMEVDHKNGNTLDCRRNNLRIVTHGQNMMNSAIRSHNTSGLKGVSWNKQRQKWRADIRVSRRQINLGFFADKDVAYAAYCEASQKHHGEFGRVT
jgi:hypothetical protein